MKVMKVLIPDLKEIIVAGRPDDLKEAVSEFFPVDIAEIFEELDPGEQFSVFSVLDEWQKVAVFDELEEGIRYSLLKKLPASDQSFLLNTMSPDERADFFEEIPEEEADRLFPLMKEEEQKDTKLLTAYPPTTAGGRMTTEYASLLEDLTVAEAIDYLRKTAPDKETIYTIYVISEKGTLIGIVSLKDLILAPSHRLIEEIMDEKVISVKAEIDQEEVASVIRKYDLLAVPVTDAYGKLIGIITVDDIMDIIREENTEDFYRLSAAGRYIGKYLEISNVTHGRQRIQWLIILLFANLASGFIIHSYQGILQAAVILTSFIPVLMGASGNSGNQSSTTIVRGLAIGEVTIRDFLRVFRKELCIGVLVGAGMGVIASGWAFFIGDVTLAITVFFGIVTAITVATTIGGILPIITKKLGFDPALMSGPFIASTADIFSLIIFFNVARLFLNLH
ncbi:MAG: magnesium transporter [Acidobacteriota bacterium]